MVAPALFYLYVILLLLYMISQKELINKFLGVTRLRTEIYSQGNKPTHNLSGKVNVYEEPGGEIVFEENLRWENENSLLMNSRNIYRWTFLPSGSIKLEHLRFGKNRPVFLVEFLKSAEGYWTGLEPHNCNSDLYSATLKEENDTIILHWSVSGPTENYILKTAYS